MILKLRPIFLLVFFLLFAFEVGAEEKSVKKTDQKTEQKTETKKSGKVRYKKVQEVSFDDEELDGIVRNPMGAYVTDKKTMKFLPLYEVKEKMEQRLLESLEYLK